MRLILHVGTGKTGTTSVQGFFHRHEQDLGRCGLIYPRAGRTSEKSPAHHALGLACFKEIETQFIKWYEPRYSFRDYADHIRQEIASMPAAIGIVSSEYIAEPEIPEGRLAEIAAAWHGLSLDVFIVFRQQRDYLLSSYAQHVWSARADARAPLDFLKIHEDLGFFDYDARLRKFENVFGQEHVWFSWYETIRADLIKPFEQLSALQLGSGTGTAGRANRRLSWPTSKGLRASHRLLGNRNPLRRYARLVDEAVPPRMRDWLDNTFAPYSEAELEGLDARWEPTNRALAARRTQLGATAATASAHHP